MNQAIGSVYLDGPQPPRKAAPKALRGLRRTLAGLLALLGLAALSATAVLGGIHLLATNPDTIVEAANKTLDDPAVQQELQRELATAIESELVNVGMAQAAAARGVDVTEEALRLAPLILTDETFRRKLDAVIITAHDQILLNPSDEPMDLTALTLAATEVIERESTQLSQVLSPNGQLYDVTAGSLPDLTGPVSQFERALLVMALLTLSLPLAGLAHPHWDRVVAWVGRWALLAGLVAAFAAIASPKLAGSATGFHAAEVAVQTVSIRLLGPAALAGVIGMGLVSVASALAGRRRNETADHGAAHALGLNEPERFPMAQPPRLDLPDRELVDVAHPLTNI